jgi:two-component system, NtrC family, response regulator AtoC
MAKHSVLVVDDEVKMQRILEIMLRDMQLDVIRAGHGKEALEIIARETIDLIITDMRMPVMDGIELIKALHARGLTTPVILITAFGTIESAVTAMQFGAVDYLLRPFEVETVELAVKRALALTLVRRENRYLREEVAQDWRDFVGDSAPMRELYSMIAQVGPSDIGVLIAGETGTGKELVARAIHRASGRAGLFVPINCAGIPEALLESELFGHVRGAFTGAQAERSGKFEISDGGTLFLDEVTEMSRDLQTRLLRVLQERSIERLGSNRRIDLDLRVIAATNRDPKQAVADNRLREDVYYRLNGFCIEVPPLRARGADIVTLAEHFLAAYARRLGRSVPPLDKACHSLLTHYPWPGNVRELENLMGRVVLLGETSTPEQVLARELGTPRVRARGAVPSIGAEDLRLEPQVDALERQLLQQALSHAEGNKAKAARLLEISERTLWYKLKKLGLN